MFKALIASVAMAAAAVTCAGTASAATENLIYNSGFDPALGGWTATGPGVEYEAKGNNYFAVGGVVSSGKAYWSQNVATTIGASYTLSFDVASLDATGKDTNSFEAGLGLGGVNGKTLFTIANEDFSDFTNYVLTFTATASKSDISFMMQSISGWWQLDNVSLTENAPDVSAVPLPGSLVLFASGLSLIGFVAWRNKRGGFARSIAG